MGSGYLTSPLMLIINTLFDLYILLVLLRFLLQMLRADFYNPVSQFIVRLTTPPLKILRRFIPSVGGQDTSSIVLCLVLIFIKFLLMRALSIKAVHIGGVMAPLGVSYGGLLIFCIADLIALVLTVFLVAVVIKVILTKGTIIYMRPLMATVIMRKRRLPILSIERPVSISPNSSAKPITLVAMPREASVRAKLCSIQTP